MNWPGIEPRLHDDRHATVVKIYTVVFWVTTYYPLIHGYQCFWGTHDPTKRGMYLLLAALRHNLISGSLLL
jgi:hypothetical protein